MLHRVDRQVWRATARHATRSRAAWQIHAMRYDQIIDVVSTHKKERPDELILKPKLEPQETEVSCNRRFMHMHETPPPHDTHMHSIHGTERLWHTAAHG